MMDDQENVAFASVKEEMNAQLRSFVYQQEQAVAKLLNVLENEYASFNQNMQHQQEVLRQRTAENEEYFKSLQKKEETIESNKEMYQQLIQGQMEKLRVKEAELHQIYRRKNQSVKVKLSKIFLNVAAILRKRNTVAREA